MSKSKSDPNVSNQTAKGLMWAFSGKGAQALLQTITVLVLARLLDPRAFGIISAALIVVHFCDIFVQLGIGPALVQRKEIEERHISTGLISSIFIGIIFTIVLWFSAPLVSHYFNMGNDLTPVLKVFSLLLPIQSISVVSQSLVQRSLRFRTIALIEIFTYLFGYGFVGITMAFQGYGIWALVIAVFCQITLRAICFAIAQPHTWRPHIDIVALRELAAFGGGHSIARIANFLALQGDNIVVGRVLGPQALGLYGRAYQLMTMPASLIGDVMDRVMFPVMSRVRDDRLQMARLYFQCISAIALIVLPISGLVLIYSNEIVLILLGDQWTDMIVPLKIFALGMLVRTSYKISDSLIQAEGAVYSRAYRQILYAMMVFIGAWIGAQAGIIGVCIGVLVAIVSNFILMANLSLKLLQANWSMMLRAHLAGLKLSIIITVSAFFLRKALVYFNAPILVIAILGAVGAGLALGITLIVWPSIFKGSELESIRKSLFTFLGRSQSPKVDVA